MISVGSLFPNGKKFLDLKLLLPLATTFRMDTEALKPQLETCKLMLMRMTQLRNSKVKGMCSLFDFYRFILPHKDSLYCLFALVCIAWTLPKSTACCERSFVVCGALKHASRLYGPFSVVRLWSSYYVHRQEEGD